MFHFMLATLIGVFLTPSGIVVAADTTRSLSDGRRLEGTKIHLCGQNVVGLSGGNALMVSEKGRDYLVDSRQVIVDVCKSVQSGQSVRDLMMEIAAGLVRHATATRLPGRVGVQPSGRLQTLIVVGYEDGKPAVWAAEIGLEPNATQFSVLREHDLSRQCRTIAGDIAAEEALWKGQSPMPRVLSERTEVQAVRAAQKSGPPCSELSRAGAEAFFRLAVDVTVLMASEFGDPVGTVNWPIDFTFVQPKGVDPIRHETRPVN